MYILFLILIVIAIIAVIGIIYLSFLPGSYNIKVTRFVNAPVNKVFETIVDFKAWPKWDPWTLHEPNVKLEYSKDYKKENGYYTWDGKLIGAGKLTHKSIVQNKYIKQQLNFTRPWRSNPTTEWEFQSKTKGGKKGTEVSWLMEGKIPFFMRFILPFIKMGITTDYELGLIRINQLLDKKADKFALSFPGVKKLDKCHGLYSSFAGSFNDLPKEAPKAFKLLMNTMKENSIKPAANPFTTYSKPNMKKNTTECDFVFPVESGTKASGFGSIKSYPGGKYFLVSYKGTYDYLKHAWNSSIGHVRMNRYKMDKSRPSLEVYINNPAEVKSLNDAKTDIYIPIK